MAFEFSPDVVQFVISMCRKLRGETPPTDAKVVTGVWRILAFHGVDVVFDDSVCGFILPPNSASYFALFTLQFHDLKLGLSDVAQVP